MDEALTFLFGGYDTSSTGLYWALCLLGLHSDIQDRVFQELHSVFGDDKTREVRIEDVKSLVYLEQVIKETLRLYPPVPLIGRENKESIKVGSIYAMMEMKIILAHLLRNFKITTLDPLDKVNMMMTVTLRCLNTPRLRFSFRT
ncbi:cytochrome P450 4g1-like [Stegodyphus dumicola]|uniref:cytochrome P450 4g1-like n=1 Tax=Stegodyphus dumicola TaxID=202533 RepID=UPI0015AF75B8|nr:cytochrome P450 4g1-like [Stegodyphus dumicola]